MTEKPVIDHSDVAEEINSAINYAMYSVFKVNRFSKGEPDIKALEKQLAEIKDLKIRGWYDISGFRSDADILVWWHAPEKPEPLQEAYNTVINWANGAIEPVWSSVGVHRAAEFNKRHVPAFLAGEKPKEYLSFYPFVRDPEWYLLPDDERSKLLREHGMAAKDYGDVLANTISAFGLNDYEWLLAFEADEL
ncbi:MAG: chlorite dismutase family protein, partial [Micrococcaceae bacterium]